MVDTSTVLEKGLSNKELKKWVIGFKTENKSISTRDITMFLKMNGYKKGKSTIINWCKGIKDDSFQKFCLLERDTNATYEQISLFLKKARSTIWTWRDRERQFIEVDGLIEEFNLFLTNEYYETKGCIRDGGIVSGHKFKGTTDIKIISTAKKSVKKFIEGREFLVEESEWGDFSFPMVSGLFNKKHYYFTEYIQRSVNKAILQAVYNGVKIEDIGTTIYYETIGYDFLPTRLKDELKRQQQDEMAIILK